MYLNNLLKENERLITIILIIVLLILLFILIYRININKNKQTGSGEFDEYDEIVIPRKPNIQHKYEDYKPSNSNMKVYQSIQTYDSRTNEMKVNKQYNEYKYNNNDDKWENTFSKHFNDSYYITPNEIKKLNLNSDYDSDLDKIDYFNYDLNENINLDDYAFKLDTIKGGEAYYKVVKLTENEKNQFYGGADATLTANTNNEIASTASTETNTAINNEIASKISNSFADLSNSSFNKVNELMTISINGQLKTITQNQLDNIKKTVGDIKQQAITLSKDVIAEITKYITGITTSFAAAITKITTYIAEVAANPINLLVKWLSNPKTIATLGATAIKVGIKNITNVLKIIHPTKFILDMIYNNVSAFISIVRSFYNAIVYSKIVNEIKNAFTSISKPFKENKLKYITFLKPYVLSLYDVLTELFNLFTPKNLEQLLQDCLKIIFNKNELENNKKNKVKLSKNEITRKVNEVFDVLKKYISKVIESIKTFANNFKSVFDNVSAFICGNINSYSVPEETLGKLDI